MPIKFSKKDEKKIFMLLYNRLKPVSKTTTVKLVETINEINNLIDNKFVVRIYNGDNFEEYAQALSVN